MRGGPSIETLRETPFWSLARGILYEVVGPRWKGPFFRTLAMGPSSGPLRWALFQDPGAALFHNGYGPFVRTRQSDGPLFRPLRYEPLYTSGKALLQNPCDTGSMHIHAHACKTQAKHDTSSTSGSFSSAPFCRMQGKIPPAVRGVHSSTSSLEHPLAPFGHMAFLLTAPLLLFLYLLVFILCLLVLLL